MRLIDADALLEKEGATGYVVVGRGSGKTLLDTCRNYLHICLSNAPTIDAVPVVRCKDCKCSGMYAFGDGSNGEILACLTIEEDGFVRFATAVDPDHFCSYGERRSE